MPLKYVMGQLSEGCEMTRHEAMRLLSKTRTWSRDEIINRQTSLIVV